MIFEVLAALSCPVVQIYNYTDTWTQRDIDTLETTKGRCILYFPLSPCVKTFVKKEELVYNVVCTEEIK